MMCTLSKVGVCIILTYFQQYIDKGYALEQTITFLVIFYAPQVVRVEAYALVLLSVSTLVKYAKVTC